MNFYIIAFFAIPIFSKSIQNEISARFLDEEMSQDLIQTLQMLSQVSPAVNEMSQMSQIEVLEPLSRTPRHRRFRKSTNNLPKKLCNPKLCNKCDKLLTQPATNEFTGFCVRLMRINNCCDHHRSTMDRLF